MWRTCYGVTVLTSDVNWYVGSFTLLATKRMMKKKSFYTSHLSIPTSPHKCLLELLWKTTLMTSRVAKIVQFFFNQFMKGSMLFQLLASLPFG